MCSREQYMSQINTWEKPEGQEIGPTDLGHMVDYKLVGELPHHIAGKVLLIDTVSWFFFTLGVSYERWSTLSHTNPILPA